MILQRIVKKILLLCLRPILRGQEYQMKLLEKINQDVKKLEELSVKLNKLDSIEKACLAGVSKIFSNGDLLVVNNGYEFFCFPRNQINHAVSYLNKDFDIEVRSWVEDHCHEGSTFIDIGANVGVLCGVAARKVGATGKIVSIEPIAEMEGCIRQNILFNSVHCSHDHYPIAIGEEEGEIRIQVFKQDNRISTAHSYKHGHGSMLNEEIVVRQNKILDLELELSEHCCIKVDAEGQEKEVLNQLLELVRLNPNTDFDICFEYAPQHLKRAGVQPQEILAVLSSQFKVTARFIDSNHQGAEYSSDAMNYVGNLAFFVNAGQNHSGQSKIHPNHAN